MLVHHFLNLAGRRVGVSGTQPLDVFNDGTALHMGRAINSLDQHPPASARTLLECSGIRVHSVCNGIRIGSHKHTV